jgi:arylsulfatase
VRSRLGAGRAVSLALAALILAPTTVFARGVILLSVDDLRADAGGGWPAEFRAFFSSAAVFDRAYSAGTWTVPSHASMLTGLYPASHGAGGTPDQARPLAPGTATLAERLSAAGVATGGFVSTPYLDASLGFARGFSHYESGAFEEVLSAAALWAKAQERPFFLFVHTYAVHQYWRLASAPDGTLSCGLAERAHAAAFANSPEACRDRRVRYRRGVACFGDRFGHFLSDLGPLADESMIIVTSDHGESLCELHDGRPESGHAGLPYDEVLHVPLAVRSPGASAARVARPVSLVDVAPTVEDYFGLAPAGLDGIPLLSPAPAARPLLAEGEGWKALLLDGLKLSVASDGRRRLVDARADPSESADLIEKRPAEAERLEAALAALLARARLRGVSVSTRSFVPELSEELKSALRGAGYLAP